MMSYVTKLLSLLILLNWATIAFGNEQFVAAGFHDKQYPIGELVFLQSGDRYAFRIDTDGPISSDTSSMRDHPPVQGRLPGEFERQHALLVSCHELLYETPELFIEIVQQTAGRVVIIALVSNAEEHRLAESLLQKNRVRASHIRFAEVPHDTMWTRDYGPIIIYEDKCPIVLDADYDPDRPNDDRVPEELAHMLNLPLIRVPLMIDGGNMLSNGEGLAVATAKILDDNIALGVDETVVIDIIKRLYGFKEIVILESLYGEETGHVDMFATFTSPDTIVVGAYDPEYDPENAGILDRNAARLAEVRTGNSPLHVVRIPMPPHFDNIWRTYTNVIFANSLVLVPVYPSLDYIGRLKALTIFARMLPNWKVVGIDASRVIECDGALHCISMNLGPIGKLPQFSKPQRQPQSIAEKGNELAKRANCEPGFTRSFTVACDIQHIVILAKHTTMPSSGMHH